MRLCASRSGDVLRHHDIIIYDYGVSKYMENHLLFLHDFEVPFDDNMSERDLRKAKNRQKIAGGFRKESGHEMYCNILTIIETLKRRNMVLLENIKSKRQIIGVL